MTRAIAIVAAAVAVAITAALMPTTANAATVRCDGDTYAAIDPAAFPSIHDLRAVNLPRRSSGYAPRCLVAESVAMLIQVRHADTGELPNTVWARGARWNGGVFRCVYTDLISDEGGHVVGKHTVCRKRGNQRRRVTMDLGS